jgi:DNA-binding winged helix-turn-helix (wHTH) protein
MKYKLGNNVILDTHSRTLSSDNGESKTIRPKTLQLLLYLAQRKGTIIPKQELLDNVWDDVKVDEGVIFQSIAELRKLLGNNDAILNYPRRGYEFTEELVPFDISKKVATKPYLYALVACMVLGLLGIIYFVSMNSASPRYEHHVAVLPVKNHVPFSQDEWVSLGGMEQMITRLQGLSDSVYVYQSEDIPRFMHQAGLNNDFVDADVTRIFNVSGASLIIETDIYGGVHNYNLVYKLHVSNDVKQGSIFATSIETALEKLSNKIAEFVAHPLMRAEDAPAKEFSDALFAQAIVSYESDWKSSISFFESYLALNPESLIANIYLARLYIWQNRVNDAEQIIARTKSLSTTDQRLSSLARLVEGQLAAAQTRWQDALSLYETALNALEANEDWSLKADILFHKARAFEANNQDEPAINALNQALSFYQVINSPIGTNSTRIHLARLMRKKGEFAIAKQLFSSAKKEIQTGELTFLYALLDSHNSLFEG